MVYSFYCGWLVTGIFCLHHLRPCYILLVSMILFDSWLIFLLVGLGFICWFTPGLPIYIIVASLILRNTKKAGRSWRRAVGNVSRSVSSIPFLGVTRVLRAKKKKGKKYQEQDQEEEEECWLHFLFYEFDQWDMMAKGLLAKNQCNFCYPEQLKHS